MNIYNFDESGFILGKSKIQKIITTNLIAAQNAIKSQNKSITLIEYIIADS
jgi:hypothetical protein